MTPPAAGGPHHRTAMFSSSTTRSHVESDFAMDNDSASVAGQISIETNSALKEGFTALDAIVIDTAKNTNMPSHQVISLWMKSQG